MEEVIKTEARPDYYKKTDHLESSIRDVFNFLPNPIFFVSSAGTILDVNPAFEKISGYESKEIIDKKIEEIIDKKEAEKLFKKTINEGFIKAKETLLINKENETVPVSVSVLPRKNDEGKVIGFFFGLFELTEIKKAEKDLKDTQAALTNMLEDVEETKNRAEKEKNKTLSIINNLTDGILFFDGKKRFSLINPAAEAIFEIRAKDLVGKASSELEPSPTLGFLMDFLEKEKNNILRKEVTLKENLILEVSVFPISKTEEKVGTLVILHNISRDKIIERMKGEFVSLAAHQLRTPLSAIKWTMKMLIDGDLGDINKEQKEFLEKTYSSNERMIKLINDLLNVTRIEEGRYLYKPVLTNLEPVVRSVLKLYKEEFEKRNLRLEFKKPEENLPWVMLDAEKIKLAIQNLIENAVRYTPSGGLVTASLKCGKNEVELSVKDNGVGIPKDQQERIFTKFFRADNVVRMDTEGSGLGLFIAKNIVEAHGGKIWFESKKDKGATFYFSLPAKEDSESPPE